MTNALTRTLLPAYAPCPHFCGACWEMRWSPVDGHVPRGVCGATGQLSEVELVLVTAEPGDPLEGETHSNLQSAMQFSVNCLSDPPTAFHKNIRLILALCFPDASFEEQLRRTWRTNSVLCSAKVEGGRVPRAVEKTCIRHYLSRQLALLPQALVAALGRKAQRRLASEGIRAFPAVHPSSRKSSDEKRESWEALARELHKRRTARHGRPNRILPADTHKDACG